MQICCKWAVNPKFCDSLTACHIAVIPVQATDWNDKSRWEWQKCKSPVGHKSSEGQNHDPLLKAELVAMNARHERKSQVLWSPLDCDCSLMPHHLRKFPPRNVEGWMAEDWQATSGEWVRATRGWFLFGSGERDTVDFKTFSGTMPTLCGGGGWSKKVNCGHRARVRGDISQRMRGDQAIATQWATVWHKDSGLLSLGGFYNCWYGHFLDAGNQKCRWHFAPSTSVSTLVAFSSSVCLTLADTEH